jgi:hypothetical protein
MLRLILSTLISMLFSSLTQLKISQAVSDLGQMNGEEDLNHYEDVLLQEEAPEGLVSGISVLDPLST